MEGRTFALLAGEARRGELGLLVLRSEPWRELVRDMVCTAGGRSRSFSRRSVTTFSRIDTSTGLEDAVSALNHIRDSQLTSHRRTDWSEGYLFQMLRVPCVVKKGVKESLTKWIWVGALASSDSSAVLGG
jgi:hypothetical protein